MEVKIHMREAKAKKVKYKKRWKQYIHNNKCMCCT